MKVFVCFVLCLLLVACQKRMFVMVGNGYAIQSEAIDRYVREHGVTRKEAAEHFRKELDAEKTKSDAATVTP